MSRAGAAAFAALLIVAGCEVPTGPVIGTPVASNPILVPQTRPLTPAERAELDAMIALAVGDSRVPDSPGTFWSLVISGYRDPAAPVRYVAGEVPTTACATSANPLEYARNAFYCPADETIAYDYAFLELLYGQIGPGAPLAFLAHEWGHHVQKLVGFPQVSKAAELQADCFAGLYLGWLHADRGRLTAAQIAQIANNFFYVGDDTQGAFYSQWYDAGVHGNGNQRRMAFVVGFDGANYGQCAAYRAWSESAAIQLSAGRWLVPAPGLTATNVQHGSYRAVQVSDGQAQALIIADLQFGTADATAAMPSALQVLGVDRQPNVIRGAVSSDWLTAGGLATGTSAWMPYTQGVAGGTLEGMVIVHIAADGNGMVWHATSTVPDGASNLLDVMHPGYCERAAPLFGACPVPDL